MCIHIQLYKRSSTTKTTLAACGGDETYKNAAEILIIKYNTNGRKIRHDRRRRKSDYIIIIIIYIFFVMPPTPLLEDATRGYARDNYNIFSLQHTSMSILTNRKTRKTSQIKMILSLYGHRQRIRDDRTVYISLYTLYVCCTCMYIRIVSRYDIIYRTI